jgi:hypothetical protein
MSTKTTFKRVALVAVAALGLGAVTSVAPATALTTGYTTGITVTTNSAPVAGNAGAAVVHTAYFKTSTTTLTRQARPNVLLISSPATSNMTAAALSATALVKGGYQFAAESTIGAENTTAVADTTMGTQDSTGATASAVNRGAVGERYAFDASYLHAWYDVAGTYKWVFWDDLDASGTINGSEYSQVVTVVVADGTAAITGTITPVNATSAAASTYGSLVKISLADAAGNPANIDSAGGVKVTVSGSAIITTGSNTTSSYIIPRSAFNGSGNAWINVTNATAEVVAVTLSGVGSTTVTATAKSLTFATAPTGTSAAAPVAVATGSKLAGASGSYTSGLATTITLKTGVTAVTTALKEYVDVTDNAGKITGIAGGQYSYAVTNCSTAAYALSVDCGSFSIATGFTQEGQTITVAIGAGSQTITATRAALTAGTIAITDYTRTVAKGSANSFTITVKDQYGTAYASAVVTPSLSATSRNYGLVTFASLVTDASGKATLTYTDVSTSTTNMVDTLNFTSTVTATNPAVITYTADATLGISTRLITSNDTDALGVAKPVITPVAISTGDGVEAGVSTVSVTLKNAAGTLLSGVPVTWSVAGTTAAIDLPTHMTTYSTAGVASADVYAWATGTYTVTATAGGVAVTVPVTFASTTPASARIVSATVAGERVTAKVVDRLGNPVVGVDLSAKSTAGYFGTGSTTATGQTGTDGTVNFVLLGGAGDVTISASKTVYPQTIALKDASSSDAADVYAATVAATAIAAATGVGATFAPAGVNSVTVAVTGADTLAQAATDAAAEATDAANAATDAANAAAEAADAATAAAQDAADAVAALSTQVSEMVNALKKQITALTNLVIKIQKKVKA